MKSAKPFANEINAPVLLLVEGEDEAYLVRRMCAHWFGDRAARIDIENAMGGPNLPKHFKAIAVRPSGPLRVVGIITDSEQDPAATAQRWNNLMRDIAPKIQRPCYALQLPNRDAPGALETLLLQALADNHIAACATGFRDCVIPFLADLTVAQGDKIAVRAWLSATLGQAYGNVFKAYKHRPEPELLNYDHSAFAPIKVFLQNLLNEAE